MRIIFDARGVQGRSDGLSNYARHLLVHLLRLDETTGYVVLLSPTFHEELRRQGLLERPNTRFVVTQIPFMGLSQQLRIPWLMRRLQGATLYHYLHFDMPIAAHARSVVTIFDLNQFHFTGYFDSLRAAKRAYSFATTALSVAKARHIVAISEATKRQLLAVFPWLDAPRISVIYFGLNDRFRTPPDPNRVRAFRQQFGLGEDRFLLYVGTSRPHKNLTRLFAAFRNLRRQARIPHKLLLVGTSPDGGAPLEAEITRWGLGDATVRLGYLADEELPLAYRVADALAFCSLSEGFGMPILEAMASEVPIVTSNLGAMAEIAGEGAVLVDPSSVESIADGLLAVLTSDAVRRKAAANGAETVKRFTWEAAARNTLEVYARVARPPEPRG